VKNVRLPDAPHKFDPTYLSKLTRAIELAFTQVSVPDPGTISPAMLSTPQAWTTFTLTDAATIAVNAALGNVATVTLGGARTMGAATGMIVGQLLLFIVIQDGTGGRTLNFATNYPKLTWSDAGNTLNKRSTIAAVWDGTNWNQFGAQSPYA